MAEIAQGVGVRRIGVRFVLWAVIGGLLVSGVTTAYLRQGARIVTVDDALREFRATDGLSAAASSEAQVEAASAAIPAESSGGVSGGVGIAGPTRDATTAAPATSRGTPAAGAPVAGPVAARIAEGVYTYRTEGYEETDAVGGDRHDYPDETAMTVRHNDCGGFVQRWQPLAERWDQADLCAGDGNVALRVFTTFHKFFQVSQEDRFPCPDGSHVYRPPTTSTSWTWTCTDGATDFTTTATFVGWEDMVIGGAPHRAARLRYDSTMAGENTGTQTQERWLDPGTGLLLKMATDIDSQANSPFGVVAYREHYVLTLASAVPRT